MRTAHPRSLRALVAVAAGVAMWVLGGAVSALNVLTPRDRPDPPDVGPELFSEVSYWSHPAWAIAAAAFAITVHLAAGLRVSWTQSRVLLPALVAVVVYGVVGGVAEAALVESHAVADASFVAEAGQALGVSFTLGWNGPFALVVSMIALAALARRSGHRPSDGDPSSRLRA